MLPLALAGLLTMFSALAPLDGGDQANLVATMRHSIQYRTAGDVHVDNRLAASDALTVEYRRMTQGHGITCRYWDGDVLVVRGWVPELDGYTWQVRLF